MRAPNVALVQTADPYELKNIYNETAPTIRDALAKRLRTYYPCT
eukprot:COSAG02_NODE_61740_length_267_cov_3.077381_1_plen_43_part_10